jgi:hypothetical protein
MIDPLISAIKAVRENEISFCKFVSANDAGTTGTHQGGLYVPKSAFSLLFTSPGTKGSNKEKKAILKWNDGTVSDCRCIYYGQGSRNEYRLTRLAKHLNIGELVIVVQISSKNFKGFVLKSQRDIDIFLLTFNMKKKDTNKLIQSD